MTNKFDLKKYLTEHKATQASILREGFEEKLNERPITEEENEKGEINEAPLVIPIEAPGPEKIQNRIGCFGRIKRWLRWISYRFWGLFWLLIYTLLIIWLCKYCDRPNCDAYCEKLKKTKEELKRLEERVRERCDTTYVKPR